MAEEPLLTPDEVAEIFRVGKATVIRMAQSGELAGVKIGRQWRFSRDDVRAYIERAAEGGDDDGDREEAVESPEA